MNNFIKKYWYLLILLLFILFGTVYVDFGYKNEHFDVIHHSDDIALEIEKANYLNKINKLNKRVESTDKELSNLELDMKDKDNNLSSWEDKYNKLNLSYQDVNKKLNQSKELLKREQNRKSYLEVPNFDCKDCDEIKTFETTFDLCKNACNEADDCNIINYYAPNKTCKLIKGLDYNKMNYGSNDMYIKVDKDNPTTFDINSLMKKTDPSENYNSINKKITSEINKQLAKDKKSFI